MTKRIDKVHKTCATIGGCAGLLGGIFLVSAVGSPLPILRLLAADAILPPLWLMGLLWLIGCVALGIAAGCVWTCPNGGPCREVLLWRGLVFLVAEVSFSFAWYSLLFEAFLMFPAWICLVIGVAAGIACTVTWFRAYRVSSLFCGGATLWLFYLTLCHLVVILHN